MRRGVVRAALLATLAASVLATACGKKGPPLPPLVLLPDAPGDFAAVRRGDHVDLTFRVPTANTDRSTPADLARVDVYAWTVPGPVAADEVMRRGARVATIEVNKPRDPDEPEPKTPAPRGAGLDQNQVASVSDTLTDTANPSAYRAYVAVGISTRGRRGALSPRLLVPLVPPPDAPSRPQVTYDEKAIAVSWPALPAADGVQPGYAVYRSGEATALTPTPLTEPSFTDTSIAWEQERCYQVRAVSTFEGVRVESAASPETCVTLHDTFAPAAPTGLVGVGSEGVISLIWNANSEADLAGYIVLRAVEPATEPAPVTPAPISDTNFRDSVPAGSRVTYAVQAVDKAGNRSLPSASITETAR